MYLLSQDGAIVNPHMFCLFGQGFKYSGIDQNLLALKDDCTLLSIYLDFDSVMLI